MPRKLIIIYNPRSTKASAVEQEVLAPARELKGWLVGKYEVKPTDVNDNVERLAQILSDGDLAVAAGGDGTAVIAANGIMQSGKDVTLGVLGYGNFNDMARMLGVGRPVKHGEQYVGGVAEITQKFENGAVKEIYPLEVEVDGKHWRYVPCYVTLGLFAESVAIFDDRKVRKKLRSGKKGLVFSVWNLAKWYFKNRKRSFLPGGEIEKRGVQGVETRGVMQAFPEGMTDYIAVNGKSLARIMRGGKNYLKTDEFRSTTQRLGRFWRLVWFMMKSILWRVPGTDTSEDIIRFTEMGVVEIHAEGEYERLEGVRKIVVRKRGKSLKVVMNDN